MIIKEGLVPCLTAEQAPGNQRRLASPPWTGIFGTALDRPDALLPCLIDSHDAEGLPSLRSIKDAGQASLQLGSCGWAPACQPTTQENHMQVVTHF